MRDSYTNRNHCPSHEMWSKCGRMRGMVFGEGGRSSGVLLYLFPDGDHIIDIPVCCSDIRAVHSPRVVQCCSSGFP